VSSTRTDRVIEVMRDPGDQLAHRGAPGQDRDLLVAGLELALGRAELGVGALELGVRGEQRRVLGDQLALEQPALRGVVRGVRGELAVRGRGDVNDGEPDVDRVIVATAQRDIFVVTGRAQIAILESELTQRDADQRIDLAAQHLGRAHIRRHDPLARSIDDEHGLTAGLEQQAEHLARNHVGHVWGLRPHPPSVKIADDREPSIGNPARRLAMRSARGLLDHPGWPSICQPWIRCRRR
jgi:hypothetical protein